MNENEIDVKLVSFFSSFFLGILNIKSK